MLAACARKNTGQLCSSRLGAGSIPAPFRIDQTVLAASLIPSPTSSPWMRRYPQPGFSRANCSTSSRSSAAVGGRPGRRGYVQRRATSSRCPRRSVAGVTNSDRFHAPRENTAERCQQRPISRRRLRTDDLALKHAQLMPQQQDLDLLLPLRSEPQHDKLEQPPQRAVHKRENHTPRTTRHRRIRVFGTNTPTNRTSPVPTNRESAKPQFKAEIGVLTPFRGFGSGRVRMRTGADVVLAFWNASASAYRSRARWRLLTTRRARKQPARQRVRSHLQRRARSADSPRRSSPSPQSAESSGHEAS